MALIWLALVVAAAFLMVSTWRFYNFKDINLRQRHPFQLILVIGLLFAGIWFFSRPVLFFIALTYMLSGVFWRLQFIFRRHPNPPPPPPVYEGAQHL
jgi:CDP-diacylglycerol--serine O-phosphatidyltransferase